MNDSIDFAVAWTKVGVVAGFLACTVYPVLIAVPMPMTMTVLLAAAFGPLLGVATLGLYHFIGTHRKTVSLQIAVVFTVIAGAIVNTMLVVQMTIREFWRMELAEAADAGSRELIGAAYSATNAVQLGLDISWFRHPRLGRIVGALGALIGVSLLSFNLFTFPVPPAEAGSIDLGPLVGIWYLVVTIMLARSIGWLRNQAE
jgi:hypothetical protein